MVKQETCLNCAPILQRWDSLDDLLGAKFWVIRDDLLPFPLPGNKVRKIAAELASLNFPVEVLISSGEVDSNHCRTLAMFAAQQGIKAHLVLHGNTVDEDSVGLRMLRQLGANFEVAEPGSIAEQIKQLRAGYEAQGLRVHVVSSGGHTVAGAHAFRAAGTEILKRRAFTQLFVASGTGATQGGLIAAAQAEGDSTEIIGVSVAEPRERGVPPVREAARWAGAQNRHVVFLDGYRAGGYGKSDAAVEEAVRIGWEHGLPLDHTYTGKAFTALLDWSRRGLLDSSVAFWHTGGLWNYLAEDQGLEVRCSAQ
ncbi:D-cysteine desulfhydrase [Corynebacterium occultum]|uniref:D-cysteine desulfhydrase n=1 Tax=Corynebacterium occultum TaxID=2675219 RepID=A0A6B8VVW5_9CORY|nr:pyridoxal-phosphate dependent enzyme [Corynebacterium occultum]QGU07269.1 D-cysteine desulfhydrase [Corynebacterium occultum]